MVNNALSLAGQTVLAINRTNASKASTVAGMNWLTNGGTLTVINLGPPLQANDTFVLFSAAGVRGVFSETNLPPLGRGAELVDDGRPDPGGESRADQ